MSARTKTFQLEHSWQWQGSAAQQLTLPVSLSDSDIMHRVSFPVSPVQGSAAAGVSILGLEKRYHRLHGVYNGLLEREQSVASMLSDLDNDTAGVADGPCTRISVVDFAEELQPLPDDLPLATDSDANKFAMLVWRMLSACESGSVGDALG